MRYMLLLFVFYAFTSCTMFRDSHAIHHSEHTKTHPLQGNYVLTYEPNPQHASDPLKSLFSIDAKGTFILATRRGGIFSRALFQLQKEEVLDDNTVIFHYLWSDYRTDGTGSAATEVLDYTYKIRLQKRGDVLYHSDKVAESATDTSPISNIWAYLG